MAAGKNSDTIPSHYEIEVKEKIQFFGKNDNTKQKKKKSCHDNKPPVGMNRTMGKHDRILLQFQLIPTKLKVKLNSNNVV